MSSTTAQRLPGNPHTRLDPKTKTAIVAQVLNGATQASVAQAVGVHRNTVSALVRDVLAAAPDPAKLDWRKQLSEQLPAKAVTAIDRSLDDTEDVHKAASTGVQVLKGLGHLANDAPATNVTVLLQQINALPPDMRACYLSNDDVIEVTPERDTL